MKAQHTPGPWEATSGNNVGKRVENGSRDLICSLKQSPFIVSIPANARLIAAAPELLEACKLALNGGIDNGLSWKEVCDILHIAIAKAEGEIL